MVKKKSINDKGGSKKWIEESITRRAMRLYKGISLGNYFTLNRSDIATRVAPLDPFLHDCTQ